MAKKKAEPEAVETVEKAEQPAKEVNTTAKETRVVAIHEKRKPKFEGKTASGATVRHW